MSIECKEHIAKASNLSDKEEKPLTEEQKLAIDTMDRPVALVAAAGSGKTTVLVDRYLRHLQYGLKPSEILMVTFTTEAALQLKTRITQKLTDSSLIEGVEEGCHIGTIHSFCLTIIEQFGSFLSFPAIEQILTPFEFSALLEQEYSKWLDTLSESDLGKTHKHFSQKEIRELLHLFYKDGLLYEALCQELDSVERETFRLVFEPLFQFSKKVKTQFNTMGLYTFDDLEEVAFRLLEEVTHVRHKLHQQFKAVLVDEFQDTSMLQWKILEKLASPSEPKLFVVGDPRQSIYRFRRAELQVFLKVQEQIIHNNGASLELNYNFRSDPNIIDSVNEVSKLLFNNSTLNFQPMKSPQQYGPQNNSKSNGLVECLRFNLSKEDPSHVEARLVAQEVKRLVDLGESPNKIAVLFRAGDKIDSYITQLKLVNIATKSKRSQNMFFSYAVVDLVNFLSAVLNPLDDYYIAAFLRSNYVGLSYEELFKLSKKSGKTLFEKLLTENIAPWFIEIIDNSIDDPIAIIEKAFSNSFIPLTIEPRLVDLFSLLLQLRLNLEETVTRLKLWQEIGMPITVKDSKSDEPSVTLMTVHSAKGLEFDHVFLVDLLRKPPRKSPLLRLEYGYPPGFRYKKQGTTCESIAYAEIAKAEEQKDLEESKRVLYVALTRARHSLTITLPQDESQIPKDSWGAWLNGLALKTGQSK